MAGVSAEERIDAIKQMMLWQYPFFSVVSFHLSWEEDNTRKTMCTNGQYLKWNRAFVCSLSRDELLFVVCHEIYHVVLKHHIRGANFTHEKFNRAADYAINQELVDLKVGKMPARGLIDAAFKGMTAEEIYRYLPDDPAGGGDVGFGEVAQAAAEGDFDAVATAEIRHRIMVAQAADMARRNPGKVPAGILQAINKLLEPKIDWRATVHRFMAIGQRFNQTWTRPNKRMLHAGFYLPGTIKEGINHLVMVRDTSGSLIGLDEQTAIASEICGAFYDGIIDRLTVIDCDAAVQKVMTYEAGDEVEINAKGGGGTSFAPAMRYIAANCTDAQAVIYFTDMYCNDFGPEPPCPTLWAIVGKKSEFPKLAALPPFGESIFVEL